MNTRILSRRLAAGALAIGAAVALATPLQAAVVMSGMAAEAIPQKVVSLRGLDFKRPADVAVAYARIRNAALAVCNGEVVTGSHLLSSWQQKCVASSVESTVATLNRGELTAYHRHEKGGSADHARGAGS